MKTLVTALIMRGEIEDALDKILIREVLHASCKQSDKLINYLNGLFSRELLLSANFDPMRFAQQMVINGIAIGMQVMLTRVGIEKEVEELHRIAALEVGGYEPEGEPDAES